MRHLAAAALLLASLSACGDTANETAEAPAAAAPSANATLDLQATGIVVPGQGGAEQFDLPFGSARAATEASIASVAGGEIGRGENGECGEGPMQMTEYDGLTLNFQEGKLVGWSASAPYVPELTRSEMLADPAVAMVEGSTLGAEFTIGTADTPMISGLFAGEGDGAAVESLWAGSTCLFR